MPFKQFMNIDNKVDYIGSNIPKVAWVVKNISNFFLNERANQLLESGLRLYNKIVLHNFFVNLLIIGIQTHFEVINNKCKWLIIYFLDVLRQVNKAS